MVTIFCCPCGDELEECANPNSGIYQNYLFLKRFFHRIIGNGTAFQRLDSPSIMLSFQGGSSSASTGLSVGTDNHSLSDTRNSVPHPQPFDAHQRRSFSQRDRLILRHEKFQGDAPEDARAHKPGKHTFWMEDVVSGSDDEELCPTCLEEYTSDNPKILTSCSHHFHLGCIYEWMERSDKCPICNEEMDFCESPS